MSAVQPVQDDVEWMTAAHIVKYGKQALTVGKVPRPLATRVPAGMVLIEVHAVSIQPADVKTSKGEIKVMSAKGPSVANPVVLGYDCSGIVLATSPSDGDGDKTGFKVGDAVFGVATHGALCPVTLAYVSHLAKKPEGLSFGEAASLVTAGLTAYQAFSYAKSQQKDTTAVGIGKVFITAGAGACGQAAVQIAKACFGASEIVSTASSAKHELVKSLGADSVIDYRQKNAFQHLTPKSFDVALDCTGEAGLCRRLVKPGGVIVSLLGIPNGKMLRQVVSTYHMAKPPAFIFGLLDCLSGLSSLFNGSGGGSIVRHNMVTLPVTQHLDLIAELAVAGKIRITIDRIFRLEETPDAFDYVALGRVTGRVLVECFPGSTSNIKSLNT